MLYLCLFCLIPVYASLVVPNSGVGNVPNSDVYKSATPDKEYICSQSPLNLCQPPPSSSSWTGQPKPAPPTRIPPRPLPRSLIKRDEIW